MSVAAPLAPIATTVLPVTTAVPAHAPGEVDNRPAYIAFGLAYLLGHSAAAVSTGDAPLLALPDWLPMALLGAGLAVGTVQATRAAMRAQRTATDPGDALSGKLLGAAWITGFAALFLAVTGLTSTLGNPDLQSVLWPTGSGLIVGLLYVAEGAQRRNFLHYGLGTWLALTSTAALLAGSTGLYWVLTLAGGGAYAFATLLERHRLAAAQGPARK